MAMRMSTCGNANELSDAVSCCHSERTADHQTQCSSKTLASSKVAPIVPVMTSATTTTDAVTGISAPLGAKMVAIRGNRASAALACVRWRTVSAVLEQ